MADPHHSTPTALHLSQLSMFGTGVEKETIAKIQQLANEKLIAAKEHGVGFDEVRLAAEQRGWLTGHEFGRTLSFGAALMRAAGGVVVRFRKSKHGNSNARRIAVYVHKKYDPEPAD